MDRNRKIGLLVACSLVAVILVIVFLTRWLPPFLVEHRKPPPPAPWDFEWYYTAQTIVSVANIALSIFLTVMYGDIYRKTRSDFSVALMMFAVVLLLSSLTSNPVLQSEFGFTAIGLGPFAMLPMVFQCIGLIILSFFALK